MFPQNSLKEPDCSLLYMRTHETLKDFLSQPLFIPFHWNRINKIGTDEYLIPEREREGELWKFEKILESKSDLNEGIDYTCGIDFCDCVFVPPSSYCL